MPITYTEILGHWLDHVERRTDLSPVTKVAYERLGKHLRRWAGAKCGCHVDLAPYVASRRALGISPRTLALEVRVAGIAWHWAEQAGLLAEGARLSLPKVQIDPAVFVENHRTPKPDEVAAAIAAMPRDDWRLATLVLARTGARIGEVVNLRQRDFDEAGGRVCFGGTAARARLACAGSRSTRTRAPRSPAAEATTTRSCSTTATSPRPSRRYSAA